MVFNQYGGTSGVPESQQPQSEDYSAPKPMGAAEGYNDPETTREALLRMGRAFNEGGVGRAVKEYQNDPNLVATLQRDPRLLASIANNPNPRNETPDSMAVNALAGAFYKTDVIRKMVTGNGMDESVLANPKAAPQGLWDQLKGVFTDAQAKPGSPQQIANEAYFGALTRGGGIPSATQAYAQTYVQAVQGQQQLTNTQLTKALDYGLKKADQASNAQRVASATARSLSGTGLDGTVISGISDEIGMISATAKDNPGVAVARSQALIQQLIDQNAPQSVINKVTTQLSPHIKLEGDAAKMYDEISKYDLSQGVLNRFKFGLSNENDLRQINRAREQYQLKEGRIKSQLELEKERQLKTDPAIMGGEVLRKANEKLLDINKERADYGLPPVTLEQQFPELARGRAAAGPGGVTESVVPVSPSAAQGGTGLPPPVAPAAPPMTLSQAKAIQAGQQNVAEAAGTILGKEQANLDSAIKDADKAINLLDSGDHNIGGIVSGTGLLGGGFRGPVAQSIGGAFETKDAKNTKLIGDTINKMAAEGLKAAMGGQLSNNDLEFWRENKPNMRSDPEFVKEWIADAKRRMQNRISTARDQVTGGGRNASAGGPRPDVSQSGGATGGWKLKGVK